MAELYTYTGSRVSAGVKNKFGDVGSVQITDDMILAWINNGVRQIVSQAPFLKATARTNLIAGTAVYDLSTAFPSSRVLSYQSIVCNGMPLKIIPFTEWQGLIEGTGIQGQDGSPRFATDFGGSVTIWPAPTETVADGLVLYFNAYPEDLALISDVLPVPDRFYNALEDYVFAQALELDENFDAAQIKLGHHEVAMQRQFEKENQSPTDFYPTMTLAPEDYDHLWYD